MSRPRIGITLPTFTTDPDRALAVARGADAGVLDGVFAFDHLWPMGAPTRPALSSLPLLGLVAASTERVTLGPLVARIGLLPPAVLVGGLRTLASVAGPHRVIGALGTGDRLSAAENLAYGLSFPPQEDRYALLEEIAAILRDHSTPVWVGGRSSRARLAAARVADALNVWGATPTELAAEHAEVVELAKNEPRQVPPGVTWGGQVLIGRDEAHAGELLSRYGTRPGLVHGDVAAVAEHLGALARAGASWTVCSPLDVVADPHGALETLAAVAEALG